MVRILLSELDGVKMRELVEKRIREIFNKSYHGSERYVIRGVDGLPVSTDDLGNASDENLLKLFEGLVTDVERYAVHNCLPDH